MEKRGEGGGLTSQGGNPRSRYWWVCKSGLSRETQPVGHTCIHKTRFMMMTVEAEKSQDLPSASWRPRRASSAIQLESEGLNPGSWWCKAQWRAGGHEMTGPSSAVRQGKRPNSFFLHFLFCSAGHQPTLGRAIYFPLSPNSQADPLTDTPRNTMFNLGTLWPVKRTWSEPSKRNKKEAQSCNLKIRCVNSWF